MSRSYYEDYWQDAYKLTNHDPTYGMLKPGGHNQYYADENVFFAEGTRSKPVNGNEEDKEKAKAILSTVAGLAGGIPEVGPVIQGVASVFAWLLDNVEDKKPEKEQKKVRDFEKEMKTLINQMAVNNVQVFSETFANLLKNWQKADRFRANTYPSIGMMEETWKNLVGHTSDVGSPAHFEDALKSLRDGHRWKIDDKTVELTIAVLNLYGTAMYLESVVAANFVTLYSARNDRDGIDRWQGNCVAKLEEAAIFLEAQTDTLEQWIAQKINERQAAVTEVDDSTDSERVVQAVGSNGTICYVGTKYTRTWTFKDIISERTYNATTKRYEEAGSKIDYNPNLREFRETLQGVRRDYVSELRLHAERRFALLSKAITIYRRVAGELRAFKGRIKDAGGKPPSGVELYERFIGKIDNPRLIGPGGVIV